MNQQELEQLRGLPDKTVRQDIVFVRSTRTSPSLVFDNVPVENSLGWDIVVNGTYKPDVPALTLNFSVRGIGPICRICVNNTNHKEVGRTHKHEISQESDPMDNLPYALERPDLAGKSPRQVWEIMCWGALIDHVGEFRDPVESANDNIM